MRDQRRREVHARCNARYRARHPDRCRDSEKRWRAKHRDHTVAYNQINWQARCVLSAKRSDFLMSRQGTDIDEKSLTDEWQKLQGLCPYCKCEMHAGVGVNRTVDRNAVTVQRINNRLAHTKENCTLCCITCNCDFRNIPHELLLIHGQDLKSRTVQWCGAPTHGGSRLCHPSAFYRHARKKSGLSTYCKLCHNAYQKQRLSK
jgi:hypothetical protein